MRVSVVQDFGALVRTASRAQRMTQADLADRMGVSREWGVRLKAGHPRLEAQKVLDSLAVLGLVLEVEQHPSAVDAAPPTHAARKEPLSDAETAATKTPRKPKTTTSATSTTRLGGSKTDAAKATPAAHSARFTPTTDPFESLFAQRTGRYR